jgi:hypothetical protein
MAPRWYWWRTRSIAAAASMPSMTAMQASAVPVRPRPPLHATSTRSPSLRVQASSSASAAALRLVGRPKSGHVIQVVRPQAVSGRNAANRRVRSVAAPSVERRELRPRTVRPLGSSSTPASRADHRDISPACSRRQAVSIGEAGRCNRGLMCVVQSAFEAGPVDGCAPHDRDHCGREEYAALQTRSSLPLGLDAVAARLDHRLAQTSVGRTGTGRSRKDVSRKDGPSSGIHLSRESGPRGARTHDPRIKSPMLYRLS